MTIDKSGKWWVGSKPVDLRAYLKALAGNSYPIHRFRLAKCACGSINFKVHIDQEEGVARRTCSVCKQKHFICDSDEFLEDAHLRLWKCIECKTVSANVGVGFSVRDDGEVRWVYVGTRCSQCGILSCYADWKIDYAPSTSLFQKV